MANGVSFTDGSKSRPITGLLRYQRPGFLFGWAAAAVLLCPI